MKISNDLTDEAVMAEVGKRLAEARLERNLLQAELAKMAGISTRTLERAEAGHSVQLSNLIRLCRALHLAQHFETLIPEMPPSPIAQLKLQGRKRRRAASVKSPQPSKQKWTWGTEK